MVTLRSCPRLNYNQQRTSKIAIDLGKVASVSSFRIQQQGEGEGEVDKGDRIYGC